MMHDDSSRMGGEEHDSREVGVIPVTACRAFPANLAPLAWVRHRRCSGSDHESCRL